MHASAWADRINVLGSLLTRCKYADGTPTKVFEAGSSNLAALIKLWRAEVRRRGTDRKWVTLDTAWDKQAGLALFERVADHSLAYWLNGHCERCKGTGITREWRMCPTCKGTKKAQLTDGRSEQGKVLDMVSEFEGILQSHSAMAAYELRRKAVNTSVAYLHLILQTP